MAAAGLHAMTSTGSSVSIAVSARRPALLMPSWRAPTLSSTPSHMRSCCTTGEAAQ
ncbi:hypothetical protein HispidOSU_028978 [Sigmodon hispidus]